MYDSLSRGTNCIQTSAQSVATNMKPVVSGVVSQPSAEQTRCISITCPLLLSSFPLIVYKDPLRPSPTAGAPTCPAIFFMNTFQPAELCQFFGLGQFGQTVPVCCPVSLHCPNVLNAVINFCGPATVSTPPPALPPPSPTAPPPPKTPSPTPPKTPSPGPKTPPPPPAPKKSSPPPPPKAPPSAKAPPPPPPKSPSGGSPGGKSPGSKSR